MLAGLCPLHLLLLLECACARPHCTWTSFSGLHCDKPSSWLTDFCTGTLTAPSLNALHISSLYCLVDRGLDSSGLVATSRFVSSTWMYVVVQTAIPALIPTRILITNPKLQVQSLQDYSVTFTLTITSTYKMAMFNVNRVHLRVPQPHS